jgi:hypothetical protein
MMTIIANSNKFWKFPVKKLEITKKTLKKYLFKTLMKIKTKTKTSGLIT